MIFNILDNTTELWMTKYIIGEIFNSGRANLYKNPSDQTVTNNAKLLGNYATKITLGEMMILFKCKLKPSLLLHFMNEFPDVVDVRRSLQNISCKF